MRVVRRRLSLNWGGATFRGPSLRSWHRPCRTLRMTQKETVWSFWFYHLLVSPLQPSPSNREMEEMDSKQISAVRLSTFTKTSHDVFAAITLYSSSQTLNESLVVLGREGSGVKGHICLPHMEEHLTWDSLVVPHSIKFYSYSPYSQITVCLIAL